MKISFHDNLKTGGGKGMHLRLSRNKSIEAEWWDEDKYDQLPLEYGVKLRHNRRGKHDHHGIEISFMFGKRTFEIRFYDHRHADRLDGPFSP